jgi:TP901-1 family phage major tail protein
MPPTAGKNWLVKIDISTVMTTIAAQRGGALNLEAETIDTSSKDQNAWGQVLPGKKTWSVDLDGLVVESDAAFGEMVSGFVNDTEFTVQTLRPDGKVWQGSAYLTSFPHEFAFDDAATYSATFSGNGEPTKKWETP